MVAGYFLVLAALFAEPDPGPASLDEDVICAHFQDDPDVGEGADHERDQGSVAQSYPRVGHDGIEQVAGFLGREDGRFAFLDGVFRPAASA